MSESPPASIVVPLSEALPLRWNVSWALIGNFVYAASQWGILIVIARLGSPELVGQFALGLALTAPVVMLTNLKLRSVLVTDAVGEYSFNHYLALRLLLNVLAFIAIVLIALGVGYGESTTLVILSIGLAKVFEGLSDICHAQMQFVERMDRLAKSLSFRGIGTLLVVAVSLAFFDSLPAAVFLMALLWLTIALVYDLPVALRCVPAAAESEEGDLAAKGILATVTSDYKQLWQLVRVSLPLGVVMMLISLNVNIPRYFLERSHGEYELGIFAALSYIIVAGNMLIYSISQSIAPRLARLHAEGQQQEFLNLLFKLVAVAVLLGLCGIVFALVFGQWLLTLIYGRDYAEYTAEFTWIMASGGISFVICFIGVAVTSMRAFREQVVPFIVVAIVTLLSSWILIPHFGVLGASWAIFIGSIVNLVYMAVVLKIVFNKSGCEELKE